MKKYEWHRRSMLGRFCTWLVVIHVIFLQIAPGFIVVAQAKEAMAQATEPLPMPELSLGVRGADDILEGFGDVLVPVWYSQKYGMLFLNPRFCAQDEGEQEANLGLGWRQMFSVKDYPFITGANVYYDSRWTRYDNQFNQLGIGVEFLSEWVDARANYYIPDDDEELIREWQTEETAVSRSTSSSTRIVDTGDVEPEGNAFVQDVTYERRRTTITRTTTTMSFFEQYEAALEGYDAEIGMKLPFIDDYLEVRAFLGYQDFDHPFETEDLKGFKGRLEVRALPGLTLDAEIFEEERLNGTDYFVGGRIHVPLDLANLANGKNPFEGAGDRFKSGEENGLAMRMTEMVMRDVKIQTQPSEVMEIMEKHTVETAISKRTKRSRQTTEETILGNCTFVDQDNTGDPVMDGTYEHPWDVIQDGVDEANSPVYVDYSDLGPYFENIVVPGGVHVYGSGTAIEGYGGKRYASTQHPVVIGDGNSPTFTITGDDVVIAGFRIRNPGEAVGLVSINSPNGSGPYDVTRAGIASENNSKLLIRDNIFEDVSHGAVFADTLTAANDKFVADFIGNYFGGYSGIYNNPMNDGLVVDAVGASGVFDAFMRNNTFYGCGDDGLYVDAHDFDKAFLTINGADAMYCGNSGFDLQLADSEDLSQLVMRDIHASHNGGDGIWVVEVSAEKNATAMLEDITAYANDADGIDFGSGVQTETGNAFFSLVDANANYNNGNGVEFGWMGVRSDDGGDATAVFRMVDANYNENHGMYLGNYGVYSDDGDATLVMVDVETGFNADYGIYCGYIGAYAEDGKATVMLEDMYANYNGDSGIQFGYAGAFADDSGRAFFSMMDITARHNGVRYGNYASGVYMGRYGAYAEDGDATFVMRNSDFSYNYGYGFYVIYGAYAEEGNATVFIDPVTANYNGFDGMRFDGAGAWVDDGYGNASFTMLDVTANGNGVYGYDGCGYGIYAEYGAYVDQNQGPRALASVYIAGITANDNLYGGICFGVRGAEGDDEADAIFAMVNIEANYNGGDGIRFGHGGVYAQSGDADFLARNVTASYNDGNGIHIGTDFDGFGCAAKTGQGYAEGGDATAIFEGIEANSNYGGYRWGEKYSGYGYYFFGGYGVYFEGSGSATYRGDAYFSMADATANHNLYGGIYFGEYGAVTRYSGDATFVMDDVTASYNGGITTGIHIDDAAARTGIYYGNAYYYSKYTGGYYYGYYGYGQGGDATTLLNNIDAHDNSGSGVHFGWVGGAYAVGGDAFFRMVDAAANDNDRHGFYFGGPGAYSSGGDAEFIMRDITANYNGFDGGWSGIFFSGNLGDTVARTGYGGDATALFDDVTASYNGWYGIEVGSYGVYAGYGGDASLTMKDIEANGNATHGVGFENDAAYASYGNASVLIQDSVASDNGYGGYGFGDGFYFGYGETPPTIAHTAYGDASVRFDNVTAQYNRGYGICSLEGAAYSGYGDATFEMIDVNASYNGHGGVYIGGYGAQSAWGGNATTLIKDTVASYNGGIASGIHIQQDGALAWYGDASTTFDGVTANDNAGDGIYIGGYGARAMWAGDATFVMKDVEASYNGGAESGIHIGQSAALTGFGKKAKGSITPYHASATFIGVTANHNFGHGIYIGEDGARASYGNASLTMKDVEASYNDGIVNSGIHISDDGAETTFGNSTVLFDDVTANYNLGTGIYFGDVGAGAWIEGDATFAMKDIQANYNHAVDTGIHFGYSAAWAGYGDAKATFNGIETRYNNGDGMNFGVVGAESQYGNANFSMKNADASYNERHGINFGDAGAAAYMGNATFLMDGVTARYNGYGPSFGNGITFAQPNFTVARSMGGEASATFRDIDASYNSDFGIFIATVGAAASGYGSGDALFKMDNVNASYNGAGGVHIGTIGAYAEYGNAKFLVQNSKYSISGNGGVGLYVGTHGAYSVMGNAETKIKRLTANNNNGHGIYFGSSAAWSEGGDAEARFLQMTASYNDGNGIAGAWAMSFAGDAFVRVNKSTFHDNDGNGFRVGAYSDGGTAEVLVRKTRATDNDLSGASVWADASVPGNATLDLGAAGDPGLNTFMGNAYFGVENTTIGPTVGTIRGNYWGGGAPFGAATPPAVDYESPGFADPGTDWLATDPNP